MMRTRTLKNRWFLLVATISITTFMMLIFQVPSSETSYNYNGININGLKKYILKQYEQSKLNFSYEKWRNFTNEEKNNLSRLGRILYLNEEPPKLELTDKVYTILVWKHGPSIENRHLKHFSSKTFDPFEHCSVKNCRLTYKDDDLKEADIVIFHLHRTKGVSELPAQDRNSKQIWAFLTDESPFHTFLGSKNPLKDYNGYFNWSITYRKDSDIPVPYGRTVPLPDGDVPDDMKLYAWSQNKKEDVIVAVMGSNCGGNNHRWQYVHELNKSIHIDIYGGCGTLKCPGHFKEDCEKLAKYKFYLSFENSNCDEYITEKLWWNGYHKNAIPIVMGSSRSTYEQLLPPHSFINTEDFATPRDLANYLYYLNNTPNEFATYFEWKKYYKVLNEHGYFQSESFHYCRVCEALNYNSKEPKTYNDLEHFWSIKDCHPSWDTNYDSK